MNSTWTSKQWLKRAIGRDLPSVGAARPAGQRYFPPKKSRSFVRSQPCWCWHRLMIASRHASRSQGLCTGKDVGADARLAPSKQEINRRRAESPQNLDRER